IQHQTEIGEINLAAPLDHDIGSGQISMNQIVQMQTIKALGELPGDSEADQWRHTSKVTNDLPQGPAVDPLSHHVIYGRIVIAIQIPDEMWMRDALLHHQFAMKNAGKGRI